MAMQRQDPNATKALMKICKAEEVRKETELIMKPCANWEEYLIPGPISIAILGELACISAGQGDFSVNKSPPKEGFKYLRHPDSFRTCLMQVSNQGWGAFSIAHKNMDQIRLLSISIPEQVKTLVQILFQDIEVVDALLPGPLDSMKSTADKCQELALAVEKKFTDVIHMIHELLEACLSSKTGYEKELEETKRALEGMKLKQKAAEEAKKKAEEYCNAKRRQVHELYQSYSKAFDSIPEGWDALAWSVVANLIEGVTAVPYAICNLISKDVSGIESDSKSDEHSRTEDDPIAMSNVCSQSATLATLEQSLSLLIDKEGNINMKELYDEKNQTVKSSWTKKHAEELQEKIRQENECSAKDMALKICSSVIKICCTLAEALPQKSKDKYKQSLKKEMNDLSQSVALFDCKNKSCTRRPVFGPMAPKMAKCEGLMQGVMNDAQFKVKQSQEMLKMTEEEYQRSFENFKKQNEELTEILSSMRQCQVKEVDFETARKMLIKGLDTLGRVKEQWEKMVRFFQMISNMIESCLNHRIRDFVSSVKSVQKIENYPSSDFVIDIIYKQAFNASNVAHLVHMISETYTEVSSKYLMDKVGSLGRLITMDASSPCFEKERSNLADGCDDARKAIEDIVIQKKREFECNIQARVEKISSELKSVLPEVTEAEKKAIECTVKKGMRALTLEEGDQFA